MSESVSTTIQDAIESRLDHVGRLWERLERNLTAHYGDVFAEILLDVRLAFTEAVVNVVKHAHGEDGRTLHLEMDMGDREIEFRIHDTGPGFEWPKEVAGPADLNAEGGRGLFLINALMSEVHYQIGGKENVLCLKKRFSSETPCEEVENVDVRKRVVLVADDDEDVRFLITRLVEKMGCEVIAVENGALALQILKENPELDAALLDIMMPELDGIQTLKAYKDLNLKSFIPILLVTAKNDTTDVAAGFDAGADEYVVKPPRVQELSARLRAAFRLKDMTTALESAAEELRIQLREARRLQTSVLPPPELRFGNVEFYSLFRPCDYVGGDMVSYFQLDEQTVAFYLADVSGHGVPAAMFSMWLNRSLHPVPKLDGIVKSESTEPPYYRVTPPAEVCARIDQLMGSAENDKYLTIFYAVLNMKNGDLTYCAAGHPAPMIVRGDGELVRVEGSSPPVGMGLDFAFDNRSITLTPGDRLIVYSDCVLEAMSPDGEEFGEQRFEKLLTQSKCLEPAYQLEEILSTLRNHRQKSIFNDDLTLMSLLFKENNNANRC